MAVSFVSAKVHNKKKEKKNQLLLAELSRST